MAKRAATTNINHSNWDQEDEPEEMGVFQRADEEVLKKRVIKTAVRRISAVGDSSNKPSPFSSFTGFGSTNTSTVSKPFSFFDQNKKSSIEIGSKTDENTSSPKFLKEADSSANAVSSSSIFSTSQQKDSSVVNFFSNTAEKSKILDTTVKAAGNISSKDDAGKETDKKSQNFEKLKNLNLSCNSWITEHLEKNPYCILTPIFKDYEKHLAQLDLDSNHERKEDSLNLPKSTTNTLNDSQSPFFFGKANYEGTPKEAKTFEFKSSKEQPKVQFDGPKNSFPFKGLFSTPGNTGINLNVGGSVGSAPKDGVEEEDEESNEPPKSDFTPVVEEDSIYDKRCKVFFKKDSNFVPKGVGTLFLKPVKSSKSTQLLVRADTSSGTIILNTLLTESLPIQKTGKNNVMIVCVPTSDHKPPPIPVLIRVKSSEDCDELVKKLGECKSS